jgi:hypothetical protein
MNLSGQQTIWRRGAIVHQWARADRVMEKTQIGKDPEEKTKTVTPRPLALTSRPSLKTLLRIGGNNGDVAIVWPVVTSHNRNRASKSFGGTLANGFQR